MFRKRRKPSWLIDPLKVALGSVVQDRIGNLSRSHVRVKYRRDPEARFVPLAAFIQRCRDAVRSGRSLNIEHLLVAPVSKQRYPKFFDSLTDWGPAVRRVYRSPLEQRRLASRDC